MEREGNQNLLRQKAEELLKKKTAGTASPLSEVESIRLIHELQVHQIELELQNEELRHSWAEAEVANDKYIRLYDLAPSGYFTLSSKGVIIELNLTGAKMLGKDRQHLKNSLFGFFVSEETKPIFNLFLEKAFKSKAKESCEVMMVKADRLPFHVFLTGVVEDNGGPCRVTMVEISELKQAQLDLLKAKEEAEDSLLKYRISESDLKKAQSIAQLGSWKWSINTGEVNWSDEMFHIFGLDKNSYSGSLGDAIKKVIHPDDLHIVLPENAPEFSTKKPIEYRIILPDHSIRYICAQAGETILDDNGDPVFLTGVAQDITARKLADIEIRESNELSKSLLQTIPFGMDIVNETGNILFLSDNLKQYFGDESLGKKCWDLYRDDKKQCFDCPLHSGITIGETKKHEAQGVLGGKTFEIYHTGMIFNGQKAMLEAFIDISERKRAEDLLQESEKRYRTTIESISDAFFTLDNELRFTYFNKQAEELLLKTSSDVLGKQIFSEVFKEAKGSVFEEKYTRALAEKEISTFETFFGIEPYINWYDVRVYPGAEGISVFFTVITEKKKADSALRLSLSKYQSLFDLFPAGITISDAQGQIIETNSIAQHLLGLTPERQKQRLIDSKEWQIVRPDGSPMPASEFASVRALNEKCQIENVEMGILKGDDQVTWINVSATPIPIEGYGVAIVYNDITDRKQAERKIRLLNETLEQRVAERTKQLEFHIKEIEQFTYIASHDLSEPLLALTNFTNLLHEEYSGKLDEGGNKSIDFIYHSAIRMQLLLKGLLDYSLLGKDSVKSDVDCNKVVAEVLSDMSDAVKASDASITVQELPVINGYSAELRLLLQNLIHNAIKFRKKDIPPVIKISAEDHGTELAFSITDNGIGIKEQDQEKVFIIFKRMVKRNEFEGTGIGLALCKKIVELHGGKIWVESNKEGGSSFMFTIPT